MDLTQFFSSQPAYVFWLVGGLVFLFLSLSAGGEPVVASLGLAALITAIAALTVTSTSTQLIIWGVLSIALAVILRGLVPKSSRELKSNLEATVSEVIPKGGVGLVSYEGALWKARSQISDAEISPGKSVYVVGRQGLTLLVIPTYSEDETSDS